MVVRSQRAAAIDLGNDLVLVGRDGVVRRLDGDSAELGRVVLGFLVRPRTADEVVAHVEELAGPLGERRAVVHQLLDLLGEVGATDVAPDAAAPRGANIVVGVSGAIAATHAPALVAALQRRGHTVEVALTPTASRFVAEDALAALVQRAPHASLWPRAAHAPVPHVALARWADLVVVYPASATTIGRIANGEFSELVAAIALTTRAPVVLVPSMNETMLASPAVQRNLAKLRADGHAIVHGVPSREVADAPAVRYDVAGAAPAPAEIAHLIDNLRSILPPPRTWDAAYRAPLVPWASDTCDPDLAAALAEHAPSPRRVLDVGCGLGQVARHAAAAGHRVVATDTSEVALELARAHSPDADVVWLRDDIGATALVGPFDVIVDRATFHAVRPAAWAAGIRRLAAPRAVVIVKCHRTAWSPSVLPEFEVVAEHAAELPGVVDPRPIPSVLVVLRKR